MTPITIDGIEYINSSDAANYLGLTRSRISQLAKGNKFRAKRIGNNVLVPLSDVKMYKMLEGTKDRKPGPKAK